MDGVLEVVSSVLGLPTDKLALVIAGLSLLVVLVALRLISSVLSEGRGGK
ncbi:hypothetical protein NOW39_002919 [Vibrio parahaemolyticus]|nr:hypothetical protein [Vibrio parahaemolyticus]